VLHRERGERREGERRESAKSSVPLSNKGGYKEEYMHKTFNSSIMVK